MRALRIELLRSWRTFSMTMPLVVLLCLALAMILRGVGASTGGLITIHFYPVALLIPISVLTGVLGEFREAKYRYGGTWWRDRKASAEYFSRAVVATGYATIGHLAVPVVFGSSLQSWEFVMSQSVTFFFGCALGIFLWHIAGKLGLALAMPFAFVWDVLGFYNVQNRLWILNPPSWHLRASLPIFGAHPNSTVAVAGDPVLSINPWLPVVAQVIAASALIVAASMKDRRSQGGFSIGTRRERIHSGNKRSRAGALTQALPFGWMLSASALVILFIAGIRWVSGEQAAIILFTLIMLPSLAVLAGVLVWHIHEDAWQALLHRIRGWTLYRSLSFPPLLMLVFIAVVGGIIAGAPLAVTLLLTLEVLFVFQFSFLMAMRSMWLALSLATVWIMWSVLICGSELASSILLRMTAVLGWAYVLLDHPQFTFLAAPVVLTLTCLAFWFGARRCGATP